MEHFRVQELGPGIAVAIARPEGHALCNASILDLGGVTVVFDALLTPAAGAALAEEARRRTGRRAEYVVQSHYHGDHIRGTAAVAPVRVVSSRRTREVIAERARGQLLEDLKEAPGLLKGLQGEEGSKYSEEERAVLRGWFEGLLATPADLAIRGPELTFERELQIHGERRTLSLMCYGGGHSPSDVFAYLPDERTIFLGDLLTIGTIPGVEDGDVDRFVDILRKVQRLPIDRAVPGHGPPGGPPDLARIMAYLEGLRRAARQAAPTAAGEPELQRASPPPGFEGWHSSSQHGRNLAATCRRYRAASNGASIPG